MRARYNGYTLPEGRWNISKQISTTFNEAKQALSSIHTISIDGRLQGTNAAAIEAQYTLITAAYASNGFDFVVFLPTGAISERLSLLTRDAIGGVRVTQNPSVESLENAQYTTYLPIRIMLEAEYPAAGVSSLLVSFRESVAFEGGGPVLDWYRPIVGVPTRGIVRQIDTYRAVQSGEAVGYSDYPRLGTPAGAPPPIWGIQNLNRNPQITQGSPERRGGTYLNFPLQWSYEFESASPLFGSPNLWPS